MNYELRYRDPDELYKRLWGKFYYDVIDSEMFDAKEKIVFLTLKRFVDFRKDTNGEIVAEVFPSMDALTKRLKMTETTVRKILKSLEKKGVIKIKRQGLNRPNLYTIYDYACIWESTTQEELERAIKDPDKTDYIRRGEKMGYDVSIGKADKESQIKALEEQGYKIIPPGTEEPQAKEKPVTGAQPETSNTAQPTDISFSNNHYNGNVPKGQEELYSMENIKAKFEYDIMKIDYPMYDRLIDVVFNIIYDTMNSPNNFIRVQRAMKAKSVVVSRLMKLDRESIFFVIEKYQSQVNRIKYPKQYILSQLYEAPDQFELDLVNKVNHDLYGA